MCSHYGYLIEDVEMWDKGNFPLEDVPPVPDEDLADVREAEHYLRRQLPERIEATKLPVLDVQRRVRVLAAAEHLAGLLEQ